MRPGVITTFLLSAWVACGDCRNIGQQSGRATNTSTPVPIVTWHGVNDNANSCNGMINEIKKTLPDVHVLNVKIGEDTTEDEYNSILIHALASGSSHCCSVLAR